MQNSQDEWKYRDGMLYSLMKVYNRNVCEKKRLSTVLFRANIPAITRFNGEKQSKNRLIEWKILQGRKSFGLTLNVSQILS